MRALVNMAGDLFYRLSSTEGGDHSSCNMRLKPLASALNEIKNILNADSCLLGSGVNFLAQFSVYGILHPVATHVRTPFLVYGFFSEVYTFLRYAFGKFKAKLRNFIAFQQPVILRCIDAH